MNKIINKDEVLEFLKLHNSPTIKTSSTMYDGFVTCIKPIKRICGAELICNPNTKNSLIKLLKESEI